MVMVTELRTHEQGLLGAGTGLPSGGYLVKRIPFAAFGAATGPFGGGIPALAADVCRRLPPGQRLGSDGFA